MRDRDAGSGSIWVLILATGLLAVSALVLLIGGIAMARYRTASVADLAALAAASKVAAGGSAIVACETAARLALASGAQLVACEISAAGDADVVVRAAAHVPVPGGFVAQVRARAGPAQSKSIGSRTEPNALRLRLNGCEQPEVGGARQATRATRA